MQSTEVPVQFPAPSQSSSEVHRSLSSQDVPGGERQLLAISLHWRQSPAGGQGSPVCMLQLPPLHWSLPLQYWPSSQGPELLE